MVAFPAHEVDWSGAGGLLPLYRTDPQSLLPLGSLWVDGPVEGLHLFKSGIGVVVELISSLLDSTIVLAACSRCQSYRAEWQVSWRTRTSTALNGSSVFHSGS